MPKPTQKTADMASQIEDEMDVLDRIKQNRFGSDERDYSWNGVDPVHDLEAFMELIEQSEFPRKRIPLSFEDGSKEKFVLPRDPKEYEEGVRELRTKFGYMGKNEIFNDVEIIDITDPFTKEVRVASVKDVNTTGTKKTVNIGTELMMTYGITLKHRETGVTNTFVHSTRFDWVYRQHRDMMKEQAKVTVTHLRNDKGYFNLDIKRADA